MLTPETLTRHELIGLHLQVVNAANPDLVGIAGRVASETMKTLVVDPEEGSRTRRVPKEGTTFEFSLPEADAPADCGDTPRRTDEAAGYGRDDLDDSPGETRRGRKAPGSTSELPSDTAGRDDEAGQSGGPAEHDSAASRETPGNCEGMVYVTVDGATLLSRPALRTERAGDSQWH